MKLTRRELAGALAIAPAALALKPNQSPEELLKAEAEADRRAAASIAKVELAMSTEPAFVFKAL